MTEPQERAPQERAQRRRPADADQPPRRPRPQEDDDDYVLLPPPTHGGRRLLAVAGVVLGLGALLVVAAVLWGARQINPSGEQGDLVAEVVVPSGSATDSIATLLGEADVITNPRLFSWYAGWKNAGPWEAGRYVEFHENSSFDEAIAVLDDGPVPVNANTVRIPEGKRLIDALQIVSESMPDTSVEQLLNALASGEVTSKYKPAEVSNWEGFLFPDTYEFADDASPVQILQTMATKMDKVLDSLGYDKAEALQGRTAYELVTAASLVEREAGTPEDERGKVARVIYNRLDAGEPLGIDAANLYGLGRASGGLTKADLAVDSPYNTRKNPGLPPTPICLPGKAALDAAINTPPGPWKYYVLVSNDPPTHLFTDSYKEFQQAKAQAQAQGVF